MLTKKVLGFCSEAQERLIKELFLSRNYDAMSRPVTDLRHNVTIGFGLTLNILVFVVSFERLTNENSLWVVYGNFFCRATWTK